MTCAFTDCDILHEGSLRAPAVSVIVPIFNKAADGYLDECLRSLVAQELTDMEIICVDDASTDDSLSIALKYAQEHDNISVLRMKRNSRQGAARNRGIAYASGQYIGFVDSDDFISANYYRKLYEVAIGEDACMTVASTQRVDEKGLPIGERYVTVDVKRARMLDRKGIDELIFAPPQIPTCLFKRDIVAGEESSFPEGILFEDNPTAAKWIYQLARVAVAPDAIYYYRQNPYSTNTATLKSGDAIRDRLVSSNMLLEDAERFQVLDAHRKAIEAYYLKLYLHNTLGFLGESDFAMSRKELIALRRDALQRVPHPYIAILSSGRTWKERFALCLAVRTPALFYKIKSVRC